MRTVFSLLLFVILSVQVNAQSAKGKITGKVTDATTKLPVDYATVSVFKQGSTAPFNGISSDPKGNFTIDNIPAGDYKVTIDFLGYKRATIEHVIVSEAGNTATVGTILLAPVQNQLQGVTVTAKAPIIENRIDKMVYNAANDLTSQGGVAIDVLKKVPQVTVDIDGNVELQGNANVRFLINGKPSSIFGASLADALQAIPASQIKSIEVITSPGARYDAAGTGGIINIILKDSKVQGINGSINLAAATRRENGSLNFSARKGNVGLNAFFSGNAQLNTTVLNTSNRTSTDPTTGNLSTLAQDGFASSKRSGYQSGLSFNWSITPKDEFTATIGFNHFGNSNVGVTSQIQQQFNGSNTLLSTLNSSRNSDSRFSANAIDWSVAYKKNFKTEGQTLEFLYNSSSSKNTVKYSQIQDYLTGNFPTTGSRADNPGRDRETNISLDYVQPVSKTFTIETGLKAVINSLSNTVVTDSLLNDGTYINNADQTYGFNYRRNIYAGYLSAGFSLFKFLDVKAGLRNEYTTTTADFAGVNIPGYNTLVPSIVFSHKFNDAQSLKLSYNFRIERPDYRDVNPFFDISDPYNISTGNPNLKPEKSNSVELGFNQSFNSGANFYIGTFVRHNTDDLQAYTTFFDVLTINGREYNKVLLTQRSNIGTQTTVGGNIFASVPVTSKFNLRSNIFLLSRNNNNPGVANVTGFGYRVNLNASYQFPKNLMAEAFGNYNSSQRFLQGTRPQFFFYNFAVRKQFMNKNASIGLQATNPFGLYVNQRSVTQGATFNQSSLRQLPFRSFGITLSYKFGKLEFSKDKDKEGGNDEGGGGGNQGTPTDR